MRILGYILVVLFVTTSAFGQQINPVPDYIFRNQMSVGRNAPTDTAAYLSVGPRYGANKGLMPPMVVDTNAVTGVKRNGLLIFSVQLNNFAYWDSTTSRFRKITAEAVVDSVVFATRAWRQKGDDSLAAIINTKTDTALLSTRAYRQKGVDSLVTLISTLGGGTVLSVSAGTGMNFTTITTSGSVNADTNVLATRANRDKLKDSLQANIAAKVNISDTSTMLSAYLRKADTTSMLSPYLRKTDTTAMLTPYVRIAGFGLTKGTQALSVDSALMATRARVQKGIDSVASLVTTTDSVLFSTRAWRQKGVDSVAALANTKATATGTTNYLSKFTGTSSLGNSIVYATTSEVGISTPSPTHPLDVNGRVRVRTIDSTATGMNMLYADVDGVIKKAAPPAGGTVTSVSAGTGMSFTTITTTGSVSADTVALATRAWRQKGIDSLANVRVGGSGTTNRVAKFTASGTVGNSSIYDSAANPTIVIGAAQHIGIGTATSAWSGFTNVMQFRHGGHIAVADNSFLQLGTNAYYDGSDYRRVNNGFSSRYLQNDGGFFWLNAGNSTAGSTISYSERMRLTAAGRLLVGTTTEGTNTVDIAGTLRSTQGANFATSSGSVAIGTTTQFGKLHVLDGTANNVGGLPVAVIVGGNQAVTSEGSIFSVQSNDEAGANLGGSINLGGRATTGNTNAGGFAHIAGRKENSTSGNFAGYLQFGTSDAASDISERMRITSTGNVGIGTTSPSSLLHVSSDASNIRKSNAAGTVYTELTNSEVIATGGSLTLFAPTGQPLIFSSDNGPAGRFSSSKELLINTTSDVGDFKLQVSGNQYVSGLGAFGTTSLLADADVQIGATSGNDGLLQIAASNTGIAQLSFGSGTGNDRFRGFMAYYHQGDSLVMGTASTQRFTLNATGLGLGTAPAERLDVNGRARVRTIDSSGSPINMLWADNNGVIRKAAVPSGGGGSVTSVSAGTGMSFTTITTSGSVSVDTLSIATRARLYKTIDSMKAVGDVNVYNTNGTLTGNRTITKGGYNLTLKGDVGEFQVENAAGTSRVSVTNDGIVATGTSLTLFAPSAQALILSSGNGEAGRFTADKEFLIGTTSDAGAFKLQISGVTYSSDGLRTGNPNGGTAATWKLGSRVASSVALDGTQYIEVDIGGTLYYLATVSFLAPKP